MTPTRETETWENLFKTKINLFKYLGVLCKETMKLRKSRNVIKKKKSKK